MTATRGATPVHRSPTRGAPPTSGVSPAGRAGASLQVDRIGCDGYGLCAELLPELIDLDDWGYPIMRVGTVPDRLLPLARRAVDACPVLALRLRRAAP